MAQRRAPRTPRGAQVRAIFEAALSAQRQGHVSKPEIMVPLVGPVAELRNPEQLVRRVASQVRVAVVVVGEVGEGA